MDLSKIEHDSIVLTQLTADDPDLDQVFELAIREAKKYGIVLSLVTHMNAAELEAFRNRSEDEERRVIEEQKKYMIEVNVKRDRLFAWRIYIDDELAGFLLLICFTGCPFLHVLVTEDYEEPEEKAEVMTKTIKACDEIITFYFQKFTKEDFLCIFPTNDLVEEVEFALGQYGFVQYDHLDFVDYERQAHFTISRMTFDAYLKAKEE
jgi:hypothetical protein